MSTSDQSSILDILSSLNGVELVEAPVQKSNHGKADSNQTSKNTSTKPVFPSVVSLNVGGMAFTTSLLTLLKHSNSMLAAMFSGRHSVTTDKEGRYFIDRNGKHFGHILNFLRDDKLPPLSHAIEVFEEAQYYHIIPLVNALSKTCPIAGNKIKRLFLNEVPDYDLNVSLLIEKALVAATEQPDRVTKLQVSVFKEDNSESTMIPQEPEEKNLDKTEADHRCNVALTFGPWTAVPDVYDLLHCIKEDVAKQGYQLECKCIGICDQHLTGQYYCKRPVYEFKFRWW